ncbi:uncharacterized protein LOC122873121 isoform X2 [Siniperca chuatsi]|uniref:uncharacterized protein LOC122873121 isoform X2 n=1 Tax=Siniperca chuatsi TaxID=119488 RepID=UPI001CE1C3AD|nr:uncharacterized protein LOC122873121 isoform X2 [Siniperca chuatsi]
MAVLCWMAVTLGVLLSAGNCLAVSEQQLAGIVKEILNRYRPIYLGSKGQRREPMFSLVVSIPYDSDKKMYDTSKVTDTGDQVWQSILKKCDVYTSKRMVAATVLRWPNVLDQCPKGPVRWDDVLTQCGKPSMTWADVDAQCPGEVEDGRADHAEYRVLQHFDTLVSNLDENDLLLFYVLASPCDQMCTSETSPWSILKSIKQIQKWKNYAVVFSNVFKPRDSESIPDEDLRGAIERLGQSVGLRNIFRCKVKGAGQCTSCSNGNQVARYCFSSDSKPGPSQNLPSTSVIQPQRGRSNSPSHSRQGSRGRQSSNINPSAGVSTNVDSNTGGGQGGSGRQSSNINPSAGVSTNVDSNTGKGQGGRGKVRKVGSRRVGNKRRGGGNKQTNKKKKKKKKTQNKGATQWNQEVQGRAQKQTEKRQKGKQPQRKGGTQRGKEMMRINQPLRRGTKQKKG